jgi:hypothetical protein
VNVQGDGTLPSAVNPQPLRIRAVSLVPPGGTAPPGVYFDITS